METDQLFSSAQKKFCINFVVSNGGGGHIATYHALRAIIEQKQLPWKIDIFNVDTFIECLAQQTNLIDIYRLFGTTGDEVINKAQKQNWKFIQKLTMHLNKFLVKLNYSLGVRMTVEEWYKRQPDLIVSVVPLYNQVIWESLQKVKPETPVVTIMTDFADCPPGFWIEPKTGNYLICGTEKAVEQADYLGVSKERIIKTSGMVIHPKFYQPILDEQTQALCSTDRRSQRQNLGLDPDCLTGVVLFGGCGSKQMLDIAKWLEYFQHKLQLIFLCGRNEEVALMLRQQTSIQKKIVVTFTQNIPYYMYLSDFFIGKPGPASISEALAMKLPVIVECNSGTLPQEKYNADWIRQQQVGLVIPSFRQIQKAVEQFLNPEIFADYCKNVAEINNRAVFEIPEILQQILEQHYPSTPAVKKVQKF
ncbi:MAG TPA: glycosyltransferase [Nostocaceae cyanobacterium]|nr:glycosyltransferase [Nostocaceae cyanobacterium]